MEPFTFIGAPIDSVGRNGGAELSPSALRHLGLPAALGGPTGGPAAADPRRRARPARPGSSPAPTCSPRPTAIRAAVAEQIGAGARPFLAGGCCAALPGALAGARDALGGARPGPPRRPPRPLRRPHLDHRRGRRHAGLGRARARPRGLGRGGRRRLGRPDRAALVGFRDREESIEDGMRQPQKLSPPPLLRPLE